MVSLSVRTRFAAGSAPGGTLWLGEVVRALGMLGLLYGVFYAGLSMVNAVRVYNDPVFTSAVTGARVFDLLPIVAFVALLSGRRTPAKIVAFVAMLPLGDVLGPDWVFWWLLFQLPYGVIGVSLLTGGGDATRRRGVAGRLLWRSLVLLPAGLLLQARVPAVAVMSTTSRNSGSEPTYPRRAAGSATRSRASGAGIPS